MHYYDQLSLEPGIELAIVISGFIVLILAALVTVGSCQLLIYHIFLRCAGLTTYEHLLRRRQPKPIRPEHVPTVRVLLKGKR